MEIMPVSVLIVDDHFFFRKAIVTLLQADPRINYLGSAPDGEAALQFCQDTCPEVIVTDMHMPHMSGMDLLHTLSKELTCTPKMLFLTGDTNAVQAQQAFQAGARGYMLKDNVTGENLVSAIYAVFDGGIYIDSDVFQELFVSAIVELDLRDIVAELNSAETDLLRAIALGFDNKVIAQQQNITPKTVSNRLSLLYTQLNIHNRTQAANLAYRSGLVRLIDVAL